MGKGARIRQQRKDKSNRRNTVVSKEKNPAKMNNPMNAEKARRLAK
jgi:hypothetical protein